MVGNVLISVKPQSASPAAREAARNHGRTSIRGRVLPGKVAKIPIYPEFPLGVMAGDAEHDRAVLWTKYIDPLQATRPSKQFKVTIKELSAPERAPIVRDVTDEDESEGGFVHIDVDGLKPGVRYEYYFDYSNGQAAKRSDIGHFRTAISPPAPQHKKLEKVTFGGTSCTFQFKHRYRKDTNTNKIHKIGANILKRTNANLSGAASHHPTLDFFLHAGDQVYCDALQPRKDRSNKAKDPPKTPAEYHARYQQAFSQKGLRKLHSTFGMYTTWDDHEVFNGWNGQYRLKAGKFKRKNEDQPVIEAGKRSFFDHQPVSGYPNGDQELAHRSRYGQKLWGSFRWGRTLEIFILDCRSDRQPRGEMQQYISPAQKEWLIHSLKNSPAVFKFILNSCPIGLFPPHKPNKNRKPKRNKDIWEWFHQQRTEILNELEITNDIYGEPLGGICWLSGDFHYGSVGRVGKNKRELYPRMCEVLMGPGGAGMPSTDLLNKLNRFNKTGSKAHRTFATMENNYVVIQANAVLKEKEGDLKLLVPDKKKSMLKISFYQYNRTKPFYWEERYYSMNFKRGRLARRYKKTKRSKMFR